VPSRGQIDDHRDVAVIAGFGGCVISGVIDADDAHPVFRAAAERSCLQGVLLVLSSVVVALAGSVLVSSEPGGPSE
jgi:hypothetical protein